MTVEEWIEANVTPSGEGAAKVMRDVLAKADALGGEAYVTPNGRQLGVRLPAETSKGSVVALELKSEPARICLPLRWIQSAPAYREERARQRLRDDLSAIVGDLSTEGVTGYPDFPAEALEDGGIEDRFGSWLDGMAATLKGAETPAAAPAAEGADEEEAPATQDDVVVEPVTIASAPAEEEALPTSEETPSEEPSDDLEAAPAPVPPAPVADDPSPTVATEAPTVPAASEPEEKTGKGRRSLVAGGLFAAIGATALKLLRRG